MVDSYLKTGCMKLSSHPITGHFSTILKLFNFTLHDDYLNYIKIFNLLKIYARDFI
jgi:hypothetical protein